MIIYIIYRILASILLILSLPAMFILYVFIKLSSKGPFLFKQKRMGKNREVFTMYKIRTMVDNADVLKSKYDDLNEADGPVFKIRNDPRYTKLGKLLSHTGLDELPQLLNVIKGEMTFVGPRPLPVDEAIKVPKKYERRFSILPGITSSWVVEGAHDLSFNQWMELDVKYVTNKSMLFDTVIMLRTIIIIMSSIVKKIVNTVFIT